MQLPTQPSPPRKLDFFGAFLSYLIPGLGQVVQGRIAKGVLYFVSLYALFFYGMALGSWKNVWLPDTRRLADKAIPVVGTIPDGPIKDISYQREFAGQFWMGSAVWPAIIQYVTCDLPLPGPKLLSGKEPEPNNNRENWRPKPHGMLGTYMQVPPEIEINQLQRDGDKHWDLGWVYTVIAGVLNLLVIYDALAGPVIRPKKDDGPNTADGGKG